MPRSRVVRKKFRILIADREAIFRFGLKKYLSVEDDLRVVAEADNIAEAVSLAGTFRPHLVFIQVELLGPDSTESIQRVLQSVEGVRAVVMTPHLSHLDEHQYIMAGASGVISKSVDAALFVKCARRVLENEIWMTQQAAPVPKPVKGPGTTAVRPADTLTRREKAIISCLMQGWRNKEIADQLKITEQTVKNHLRTVFDKVGVSDRLELVLYAIHQRLDLPPVQEGA